MILETTEALVKLLKTRVIENVKLSAWNITELSELPVIILTGPILAEKKRLMRDPEYRYVSQDLKNGIATYEMPARVYDLRFDVNISCSNVYALIELIEKMSRLNQAYILLHAVNYEKEIVRDYSWEWRLMIGANNAPNISQVFQGHGQIIIHDVEIFSEITKEQALIRKVIASVNKQDNFEVLEDE